MRVDVFTGPDTNIKLKEREGARDYYNGGEDQGEDRVALLYSAWSSMLGEPSDAVDKFLRSTGLGQSMLPNAPHLENCKLSSELNKRLDNRAGNETFPSWTSWKGELDTHPASTNDEQIKSFRHQEASKGSYPPWVRSPESL